MSLPVWIRLMMAAARCPASSVPAKSQFLRPVAQGLICCSSEIFVDGQCGVAKVARERRPAVQAVVHGLGGSLAVGRLRPKLAQPLVQRLRDRRRARSSLSQPVFGR